MTVFADKICVDEETVRLRSHIEGMKKELLAGGSVGRKLDFICPGDEPGSQYDPLQIHVILRSQTRAILLKTEIEKVREQIQNIE